jgi:hypothetical protein
MNPEGMTALEMEEELLKVFNSYPEYNDKSFFKMVELFANDDFFHLHLVAKECLKDPFFKELYTN